MILYGDWAPGSLPCATPLPGDCALVNIEGPILPAGHQLAPARKAGPQLFATTTPHTDDTLIATLANNHTMDYGPAGLAMTLETLRRREALVTGAGQDLAAARRPIIVHDGTARVGVVACCEAQFGTADDARAGVAALGPWVLDAIRRLAAEADAVVVSVHLGSELSPWPAPTVQDLYRAWIDAGATVVHGHHPHVPQGCEQYAGGVIFYGLGNLAVNPADWSAYPNAGWSFAADVNFATRPPRWELSVIELSTCDGQLHLNRLPLDSRAAYLTHCNRPLGCRALLTGLWQETAVRAYRQYYRAYLGFASEKGTLSARRKSPLRQVLRRACSRGGSPNRHASRQDLLLWHHLFGCETHRDAIATALGVLGGELPDQRTPATTALVDTWLPWTTPFASPVEAPA